MTIVAAEPRAVGPRKRVGYRAFAGRRERPSSVSGERAARGSEWGIERSRVAVSRRRVTTMTRRHGA